MATTIPSDDEAELKTPSLGLPVPAGRWRQTFCFRQFRTAFDWDAQHDDYRRAYVPSLLGIPPIQKGRE